MTNRSFNATRENENLAKIYEFSTVSFVLVQMTGDWSKPVLYVSECEKEFTQMSEIAETHTHLRWVHNKSWAVQTSDLQKIGWDDHDQTNGAVSKKKNNHY